MRFTTVVVVASFAMSTGHAANTHEGNRGRHGDRHCRRNVRAFTTRSKRSLARSRGSYPMYLQSGTTRRRVARAELRRRTSKRCLPTRTKICSDPQASNTAALSGMLACSRLSTNSIRIARLWKRRCGRASSVESKLLRERAKIAFPLAPSHRQGRFSAP
jgi:hypothetical protein